MWRRDWPDGDDASRAVRLDERVLDSVRSADSLELSTAVDSVARFLAHSLPSSWLMGAVAPLSSLLLLLVVVVLVMVMLLT